MKVSELTGAELDYWVAKADPRCEGLTFEWRDSEKAGRHWVGVGEVCGESMVCIYSFDNNWRTKSKLAQVYGREPELYLPSQDWMTGGPIIEREHIETIYYGNMGWHDCPWESQIGVDTHYIDQRPGDAIGGPTPLIAAMRAFVASKFGDRVLEAR